MWVTNMAAMDFKVGDSVIGKCLSYRFLPQAKKKINAALDGTVYAQSTAKRLNKYEVHIFCATALTRALLDTANAYCSEVTMCDRNGSEHTGFIVEDTLEWKEWKDGHGVAHFTIIEE